MSALIYFLVLVFIIRFFSKRYDSLNKVPQNRRYGAFKDYSMNLDVSYESANQLMNRSEAVFFYILEQYLPSGYRAFPKMRIADILRTVAEEKDYYDKLYYITHKHVDFIICNNRLRPVLAIEVNGKSHEERKKIERDEIVQKIFKDGGIPLKFIKVGDNFTKSVMDITNSLISNRSKFI